MPYTGRRTKLTTCRDCRRSPFTLEQLQSGSCPECREIRVMAVKELQVLGMEHKPRIMREMKAQFRSVAAKPIT